MDVLIKHEGPGDYYWTDTEYTHRTRNRAMLKKYGEKIKKLYGPDPWLCRLLTPFLFVQLYLAYRAPDMGWPTFLLLAYFVGGTITHSCFLAVHEITHNLCFETPIYNDIYALFVNLCVPVPYAMMFKTYHAQHHRYLGWDGVDADLPTRFEGRFLSNYVGKFFFLTFQGLFYAFRPTLVKGVKFETLHVINYVVQLSFNLLVYYFFGWWPILYLLTSTILGTGWHPLAGHFISEHFVFEGDGDQETFSYYGPLNVIVWNAGYHVEHHDFPNIPWTRVHELRKIAPEYYDHLLVTDSWPKTLFRFLLDPHVNLCSRVVREKGSAQRSKLFATSTKPMKSALPVSTQKEA